MKVLAVLCLLASAAVGEPPAPYVPSGWRPNGPAFDLPQKTSQAVNVQDTYLPPQQTQYQPANEYGVPEEEDVSVQGLPTAEQTPQFLVSPLSGQQYVGPTFNADVRSLDQSYRQSQLQIQQESLKDLQRQRELQEKNKNINGFPVNQPRQFADPNVQDQGKRVTTPPVQPSTRSDIDDTDDNPEGSVASKDTSKTNQSTQEKTTVEVAKQNVQQISPELLLSPLTQLTANQYAYPLQQLGQLRAPIFYQPNLYSQPLIQPFGQIQSTEFDGQAHYAALQSVLAQRQILLGQPQSVYQTQQGFLPGQPNLFVRREQPQADPDAVSINQFNPQFPNGQLQSNTQQNQPIPQSKDAFVDVKQTNKTDDEDETIANQNQLKFIVNQPQFYQTQEIPYQYQQPLEQPSNQFVPQQQLSYNQPQVGYQPSVQDLSQYYQNQVLLQQQYNQPQFIPRTENQGQDALQSGLDINQQGNDVETKSRKMDDEDDNPQESDNDESTATAVATAFGTRLSPPRTFTQYGAPVPNARPRTRQDDSRTEDSSNAEGGPAIAEATAVADGPKKSARLRSRRIRPIFTLDKSGHLVLASPQQGF